MYRRRGEERGEGEGCIGGIEEGKGGGKEEREIEEAPKRT